MGPLLVLVYAISHFFLGFPAPQEAFTFHLRLLAPLKAKPQAESAHEVSHDFCATFWASGGPLTHPLHSPCHRVKGRFALLHRFLIRPPGWVRCMRGVQVIVLVIDLQRCLIMSYNNGIVCSWCTMHFCYDFRSLRKYPTPWLMPDTPLTGKAFISFQVVYRKGN